MVRGYTLAFVDMECDINAVVRPTVDAQTGSRLVDCTADIIGGERRELVPACQLENQLSSLQLEAHQSNHSF